MGLFLVIISITLVQLPAVILRYLPFSNFISPLQKKKLFLCYGICFIVQHIALYLFLKNNYNSISPLSYKQCILSLSFSYVLINMLLIRRAFFKHMFIFGMQGGYSLFLHSIVAIFLGYLGKGLPLTTQFLIQSFAYILLFIIVTIPLWQHIGQSLIFKKSATYEYYWNIIWLIPVLAVCSDAIVTINEHWIYTWQQMVSRIFTAFALLISWKCITLDFVALENMLNLKNTNKILFIQTDSILKQADILDDNDKKIRIFKHDMRHHLQILLSLIEHNNNAEAIQMISELNDTLQSTRPIVFCKNTVINSALLVYITDAQEHGIEVISEIDIPQTIPWNSNDIAILFANVLENAVHASIKQPVGKREIQILTRYEDKMLAISVKNKFDQEVLFGKNGFPVSTETDHGIGTQSIISIADKYHAHATCSHKDGWFCMSFLFSEFFANKDDI